MSDSSVRTRPPATSPTRRRRRAVPVLLALLLALAAGFTAVVLTGLSYTAITVAMDGAVQGPGGGLTVTTHPDPYVVYSLDGTSVDAVTVTSPDGSTLPVTSMDHTFDYGPHRTGRQVATFEAPAGRGLVDYRVAATSGAGPVTLAVTTFDAAGLGTWATTATVVLLVVNVGVAGVVLLTAFRSRASG